MCLETSEIIQGIKIIRYNKVNAKVIFLIMPLIISYYCRRSQANYAKSRYLKCLLWLNWKAWFSNKEIKATLRFMNSNVTAPGVAALLSPLPS